MALMPSELRATLIQTGAYVSRGDVQSGVERMAGEVKATDCWPSVVGELILLLIGSQGALWVEIGKLDGHLSGLRSDTGDVRAQLAQISAQLARLPH